METHKGDIPSKYGGTAPKLVNRQSIANDTVINVNGIEIGGEEIVITINLSLLNRSSDIQ